MPRTENTVTWPKWLNILIICAAFVPSSSDAQAVSPEINEASAPGQRGSHALAAKLQILLDRRGFSPGVIDGQMGENVESAVTAFRKVNGINTQRKPVDGEMWSKLDEDGLAKVIVKYEIMKDDVEGPFTKDILDRLKQQNKLDRLSYTSPSE